MTGLEILAVAPPAAGTANPPSDRNPVSGGKNKNKFSNQLKKYSSGQTLPKKRIETTPWEVTATKPIPANKNQEPECPAVPPIGVTLPIENRASPPRQLTDTMGEGINLNESMAGTESKDQLSVSEEQGLVTGAATQEEPAANSPIKLGENAPIAEMARFPSEGKSIHTSDGFAGGKAETANLVAGEALSANNKETYAQPEAEIIGQVKQLQKSPDFVHSGRNSVSLPQGMQLTPAEPGVTPPQAEGTPMVSIEETPGSEQRQTGELEKASTAAEYAKETDSIKGGNVLPFRYSATDETLKTARDPVALALWLNKMQAREELNSKGQIGLEKDPGAEQETAAEGKSGKQTIPVKGGTVSSRFTEGVPKAQLQGDSAKEAKLSGDEKIPPLKTDKPEKESAGEAKQLESGKNTFGPRTEQISPENILRNNPKPLPEKNWVDPERFMEQVVKKAEAMIKQNLSQIRIQLHPEFLGKMTIKLVLEDGLLTARFITESQQVKHLLDSNLNQLRHNLENQGIKVEKTEVNVQLNNGGLFDGSEGSRQDLWERTRNYPHYHADKAGDDAYQVSSLVNEPGAGIIQADENYLLAADGSMDFLI